MGKIISLVNPKGGSGKSTLTLCLAEVFERSMIVDFDPQGCLWSWYQERVARDLPEGCRRMPVEFFGLEELTVEHLNRLEKEYSHIFVDCPGESEAGEKTRTALVYSDLVIIPVNVSDFDITSTLTHLVPLLEDASKSNIRGGKFMFLPVFVHPFSRPERVITYFEGLGVEVLNGVFKERKVLKIFSEQGQTLSEFVDNGQRVRDRIQAREALFNIREIAQTITNHLWRLS